MAAGRKADTDEDYWGSSTASKISKKGFNLFDDKYDIEEAKNILRKPGFLDDDEEATVNWDGSLTSTSTVEFSKSARHRAPDSAPPLASSGFSSTGGAKPQLPKQPGRPAFTEEKYNDGISIDEVVSRTAAKHAPTLTDIAKLEAEVAFLKKKLHVTEKDRYLQIPPAETIRRIIVGLPYSLEPYRSMEDKTALLEEAIRLHDGNAITAAVLFMKDTVKRSNFNMALFKYPCAVEHYISYLTAHYEFELLGDVLGMLGRTEDAAILKYKQAAAVTNTDSRLRTLQSCYRSYFESEPSMTEEAILVQDHISLLERQRPIENADSHDEKNGAIKFKETPRITSLVGLPAVTTLYYCCYFHYELEESKLASPTAIRKAYRLSDKQYIWVALIALLKLRRWQQVEALFQTKGWLGSVKMKSVVGFDRIVPLMKKLGTPREVINKYCKLIDDTSRRLEIGEKMGCHEAVIDTLRDMRDRQQLRQYFDHLKPNSQEAFYCRDVLGTSTIKWKN